MSQSGPILLLSENPHSPIKALVESGDYFPIIQSDWNDAAQACATLVPAAIILDLAGPEPSPASQPFDIAAIADVLTSSDASYVPLIAIGETPLAGAMMLHPSRMATHLIPRLQAALRARTLDASLRSADAAPSHPPSTSDALADAVVLLLGRGTDYPALSAALGAHMGVVGTLSIEAAAKHLNARPFDGVVIGQGFPARMIDALLTIVSEQALLRHLPVFMPGQMAASLTHHLSNAQLPHLEAVTGDIDTRVAHALPFIAQHARMAMCERMQASDEAQGHIDSATGLLSPNVFHERLANTIKDTRTRGAHLSIARMNMNFVSHAPVPFEQTRRIRRDSARIIASLKRQSDFGALDTDGSILIVFTDTHLQNAHVIARRLASVLKHTQLTHPAHEPLAPDVVLATLKSHDDATSLCARLHDDVQRAAS